MDRKFTFFDLFGDFLISSEGFLNFLCLSRKSPYCAQIRKLSINVNLILVVLRFYPFLWKTVFLNLIKSSNSLLIAIFCIRFLWSWPYFGFTNSFDTLVKSYHEQKTQQVTVKFLISCRELLYKNSCECARVNLKNH